jgi:hypothetical protein
MGRSSYSVRREASAPEYAYPRSGYGSGRKVATGSSSERIRMFVPEPNPKYHSQHKMGLKKSFCFAARRRRCSPSEQRAEPRCPCSADEQRRESYTNCHSGCNWQFKQSVTMALPLRFIGECGPGLSVLGNRGRRRSFRAEVRRNDGRKRRDPQIHNLRPGFVGQIGFMPGQDEEIACTGRGDIPEPDALAGVFRFVQRFDHIIPGWA